jgi:hypothetical protein
VFPQEESLAFDATEVEAPARRLARDRLRPDAETDAGRPIVVGLSDLFHLLTEAVETGVETAG